MLNKQNAFIRFSLFLSFGFLISLFQGCDTTSTNAVNSTLSLSFNTTQGLNKTTVGAIELDTVKILIRDLKLENESEESDSDSHHHSGNNHENRSEDIRVGPFVVFLNLNGMTTDFAVNSIPAGFYNEIKFKIHKIEGSEVPPDPEFKEGDADSSRYSVIVKGKYNGVPFVYKSRKSAQQKVELDSLLEVVENTNTNLTITVDPYSWFTDGQTELDPTNDANRNMIDNNIKKSFRGACRDDDHDGEHDGGHHH